MCTQGQDFSSPASTVCLCHKNPWDYSSFITIQTPVRCVMVGGGGTAWISQVQTSIKMRVLLNWQMYWKWICFSEESLLLFIQPTFMYLLRRRYWANPREPQIKCQPWKCSWGRNLTDMTSGSQLREWQTGGPRRPEGCGRRDVRELVTSRLADSGCHPVRGLAARAGDMLSWM